MKPKVLIEMNDFTKQRRRVYGDSAVQFFRISSTNFSKVVAGSCKKWSLEFHYFDGKLPSTISRNTVKFPSTISHNTEAPGAKQDLVCAVAHPYSNSFINKVK